MGKLGYAVDTAESGEAALDLINKNEYDLVMLDMIMPGGMDGAETYQRILEAKPRQKAIILSGFAETDRVTLALSLGAGAFVRKPLTKRSLATAVREELDRTTRISGTDI